MGALVTLSEKTIEVLPGAVATCTVTVKNTGTVVDQFTIDILGDPAAWTTAEPRHPVALPRRRGDATVFFRPPRAAETPTGELPFGVRARSREDPAGSAVEEGVLVVGAYQDTFAELVPRTSRGSRGATHELAVDNRGQQPPQRHRHRRRPGPAARVRRRAARPRGRSRARPASRRSGSSPASASGAASPRPGRSRSPSRARAGRPSSSMARSSRRRSCRAGSSRRCSPPSSR